MSVKFDRHESPAPGCPRWRDAIRDSLIEPACAEAAAIEEHLHLCPGCREYQASLASLLAGLDSLRSNPVQPSPAFRKRWRGSILQSAPAAAPVSFAELVKAVKWLLWRNRRPALGLATIWMLTLTFTLASPESRPVQTGATAWTPIEVMRFLTAERQSMAQRHTLPSSRL